MAQQKAIIVILKQAHNIREQLKLNAKSFNQYLNFQANNLKQNTSPSTSFGCFTPKPKNTNVDPGFQRAFYSLNRVEKANFYLKNCNFMKDYRNGIQKAKKIGKVTLQILIKQQGFISRWRPTTISINLDTKQAQIDFKDLHLDLHQYIIRSSANKLKQNFKLQSIKLKEDSFLQTIVIAPDQKKHYNKIYLQLSQICEEAQRQNVIQKLKDQNIEIKQKNTQMSIFQQPPQLLLRKSSIVQMKAKQRKKSLILQLSRSQSINELHQLNFRNVVQNLDSFQDFSKTSSNIFQSKKGKKIKKIYYFNSNDKEVVMKNLSNYCYFYRFKTDVKSISLIKKEDDGRYRLRQIYDYDSGKIVQCQYSRQRLSNQQNIYFIDSLFKIKIGDVNQFEQSFQGKIQKSYVVWELKIQQDQKLRVLVQGYIAFPVKFESQQQFTKKFMGNINLINLVNQSRIRNPQKCQSSSQIFKYQKNELKSQKTQIYGLKKKPTAPNLMKSDRGHFFWTNQWEIMPKGNIRFVNEQKKNSQGKIMKKVLSQIGKQIMKGQNIANFSMPVQMNGITSATQKMPSLYGYAPVFIEPTVKKDSIQRFKGCICLGLGMYIGAFADMEKPFNPILGQTYQGFIDGCPIYSQQIFHHPPITAILMIGRGYKVYSSIQMIMKPGLNCGRGKIGQWHTVLFDEDKDKKESIIKISSIGILIEGLMFGQRTLILDTPFYAYDQQNQLYCQIQFGKKRNSSEISKYNDYLFGNVYKVADEFDFLKKKSPKQHQIVKHIGKIEGRWTDKIYFNKQVIFDVNIQAPFVLQQKSQNVLESHSNNRKDIQMKRNNKLQQAQQAKQELEILQRHDAKLRKQYKQKNKL